MVTKQMNAVCQTRLINRDWTLQKIGNLHGITRERVRQILSKHYLPTKALKVIITCANCQKPLKYKTESGLCMKCQIARAFTLLECDECHILFYRRRYYARNKKVTFCSKQCHGKWLGKNYGRGM